MMWSNWIALFGQWLVYLLMAPLVMGLLHWVKARLQRRQGPSPLQPYRDLLKLLGKRPVVPEGNSPFFTIGPIIAFTSYALLGSLMPILYLPASNASSMSDLLLIIYLLGLARMAMGVAGMDVGSPFGGIGSSRELFLHVMAEPTLIFIVLVLALQSHTTSLSELMWASLSSDFFQQTMYTDPAWFLLLIALTLVILMEDNRLPFDNPVTHLELTMFSRAILLEYAGPRLALLEWAESLRLTFFLTLLFNLYLPQTLVTAGTRPAWSVLLMLCYPVKLFVGVLVLAVWEAHQIKTRLREIVTPSLVALTVSIIATLLAVAKQYMELPH